MRRACSCVLRGVAAALAPPTRLKYAFQLLSRSATLFLTALSVRPDRRYEPLNRPTARLAPASARAKSLGFFDAAALRSALNALSVSPSALTNGPAAPALMPFARRAEATVSARLFCA